MNVNGSTSSYTNASAIANATAGLQEQNQQLQQNVTEIAETSESSSRDVDSQDRALVEQQDIVNNFQGNARALAAASDRVGTLIDLQA